MLHVEIVRYLLAFQSLALIAAAVAWVGVGIRLSPAGVKAAAFCSALLMAHTALVLAVIIVLSAA